jgi:hypothetical protein
MLTEVDIDKVEVDTLAVAACPRHGVVTSVQIPAYPVL